MASGDVVFEVNATKQDSFTAIESNIPQQGNVVDVEFSFGPGTYGSQAILNGITLEVKDVLFKLRQNLFGYPVPVKVESDSPFDANKQYKITITEV